MLTEFFFLLTALDDLEQQHYGLIHTGFLLLRRPMTIFFFHYYSSLVIE